MSRQQHPNAPPSRFREQFESARLYTTDRVIDVALGGDGPFIAWANDEIRAGRTQAVIAATQARPDLGTNDDLAHLLANCLRIEGEFDKALPLLQRALDGRRRRFAEHPNDKTATPLASTLSVFGELAFARGDSREADAWFREAIAVSPRFTIAHENRLCLGSLAKDAQACSRVLDELDAAYPAWRAHEGLMEHIRTDVQLYWFRNQPALWARVVLS